MNASAMKSLLLSLLFPCLALAGNISGTITPPTKNTDGSSIGTISGYVLSYGLCGGSTASTVQFTGTNFSSPPVADGTYCVAVQTQVGSTLSDYTVPAQVALATAPSTPVTTTNVAYKMRQAVDGYTFVAIGQVPVGTPCLPDSASGFNLIPRSTITLTNKFDTLPLLVFAKCQ